MNLNEWMDFVNKCEEEPVKPLTEMDFEELEQLVNAKLPVIFKMLYLENNGSNTNDADDTSKVYSFSPIKYGLSIEKLIYAHKKQGILYGKKIPFATDLYGHTYLLSLENDSYGQVLFLQHEFEFEHEYDFVSNDFTEFLNEYVSKGKTFLS